MVKSHKVVMLNACLFIVTPEDIIDLMAVIKFLNPYNVIILIYNNTDEPGGYIVEVHPSEEKPDDFRLAEMAFQMNFHQTGSSPCRICAKEDKSDPCGHLTFTSEI